MAALLTQHEREFAKALATPGARGRRVTPEQAYRKAWPNEVDRDVIRARAQRLASDPRIVLEVERLQSASGVGRIITRDEAMVRLTKIAEDVHTPPQVAVGAIKQLAEMQGWEAPKSVDVTANRRVLIIHTQPKLAAHESPKGSPGK